MGEKKNLAKNIFFLTLVQFAIYLSPLVLMPFLSRTLTPEGYGIYGTGFAVFGMLSVLADFGFSTYGPYYVSTKSQNANTRNETLGVITLAKFLITLPFAFFAFVVPPFIAAWQPYYWFFFFLGISVVLNSLLPVWFFQGIEKTQSIVMSTLVLRSLFVILTLVFVSSNADIWKIGLAQMASFLPAIFLYFFLLKRMGYQPVRPKLQQVLKLTKQAFPFFLSRSSAVIYTSLFSVLISVINGPRAMAFYSIADEMYRAGQTIGHPILQAVLPFSARKKSIKAPVVASSLIFVVILIAFVLVLLIGRPFLTWFLGPGYDEVFSLLVILLIALMFTAPSQILGYPALGALGVIKYANISVYVGGVLALVLIAVGLSFGIFTPHYVAYSVVAIEALVFTLRVFWIIKFSRNR